MSLHSMSAPQPNINTPVVSGGATSDGMHLSQQKDAKEAQTDAKFGEIWQKLQSKYGEKAEKPREIKKTLGKDDFLRIMMTQMKYQDPTSPFKAEQVASEMAQFASVEQLNNLNQTMSKMGNQSAPLERLAMTGMIGKQVTVDRDRFQHTAGSSESLSFKLNGDADSVKAMVLNESGETVFEKDIGSQKAGLVNFDWDGKKGAFDSKSGMYLIRVEAKDEHDRPVQTGSQIQSKIIGVSFEGSDPVFLIGDSKRQEKVTLKNIVRVESDPNSVVASAALAPQGAQAAAASAADLNAPPPPPDPAKNIFTFQKGIGSRPLSQAEAANVYQQQQVPAPPQQPIEKGFPNGLSQNNMRGGENP